MLKFVIPWTKVEDTNPPFLGAQLSKEYFNLPFTHMNN
jgi:hypothetical protein